MRIRGFIVWTCEEGGKYYVRASTYEEYQSILTEGCHLPFAYIAWCPLAEDWDFILGSSREV